METVYLMTENLRLDNNEYIMNMLLKFPMHRIRIFVNSRRKRKK